MAKKSLQDIIKENKQFGFDPAIIEIAYANVDGDSSRIIDQIFRLQAQSNSFPTVPNKSFTKKPANPQDQDAQLSKAIEMSITDAKDKKINLEPLNPEQRVRKSGVPIGLKNIGNTCYFNSLLQTYFQNLSFVKQILKYQIPNKYKSISDVELQKRVQDDFDFKRKMASCKLVENLKELFCSLIASDRKYIDPTAVISSIVDDYGNDLAIGDQKDIGQFNLTFLSRIEDGLEESRKDKQMDIEGEPQLIESPSKINIFGEEKQPSLIRHSSIRISEKSIIAKQFIGKMENHFVNQAENINKTEEELFSLLFVNVKNKQLYNACQQITISHIDDYRNDKGEVIGVEKQSWIKEAPKTLFFQIDRVIYDKEKLTLKKINDTFDFPKIFYIDPFLLKNKTEALKVQKKVRALRKQKEEYSDALRKLQNFGEKHLNLLDLLSETATFLKSQADQMEVDRQTDNPFSFPKLKNLVKNEHINVLEVYKKEVENRTGDYQSKIDEIEQQIQKLYHSIRSTPYYLYSILIHEGGADSGHYYNYIYDHENQNWKKYNDINILEEVEEQVLKEAKGINQTSAYYLVYAQKEILLPPQNQHNHTYCLSKEEGYMKDFYSSFLSEPLRQQIKADNEKMYFEIEQFKMNTFATRVVDVYAKKFETCNEIFRKNKPEKKKNTPPILINLPTYIKNLDEEDYKIILIENCINEYGPKEESVVFQDLLKKKLTNFNDFKKPKKFQGNDKYLKSFTNNVYWAMAAKRLFESIKKESYSQIFELLTELLKSDHQDYFNWLSNLLIKIFIVRLLMEAENDIENEEKAFEKIQISTILLLKYTNLEEEKALTMNCYYWVSEIGIKSSNLKEDFELIAEMINSKKYDERFAIIEKKSEGIMEEMIKSLDLSDCMWNLSRQENTIISQMLEARENVKNKMEVANNLYKEMKKYNYFLKKEERDKISKA